MGKRLIRLICLGKMRIHAFHNQVGHPADGLDLIDALILNQESQPGHACVQLDMDICLFSHASCQFRDLFCHLFGIDGHPDLIFDHSLSLIRENASKN